MRNFLTILLIVILPGCEEVIESTHTDPPPLLIVEGVITNERIRHRITLTLPHDIQNAAPRPASGAVVTITNGIESAGLEEIPENSGEYFTPEFRAVTGRTFTLAIEYQGRQFTATDRSIPVSPLKPLNFVRTPDGYLLLPNSGDDSPTYTEYLISWKHVEQCVEPSQCEARVITYDLQNIDVNEIFRPETDELLYPENSIVIRRKYSASPEYREYLRGMLSETRWRGGVFDVPRSNATGNFHGDVAGFFAVSTVVADTTILR
jgi:hypothetical protein